MMTSQSRNIEWKSEYIYEFLEVFELSEVLWNPRHSEYKNKFAVADTWKKLQETLSFEVSVAELKRKKEGLMSTFRATHQKVVQTRKPGAGTDDVYTPSWPFYKIMERFLRDRYMPNPTINSETSHIDPMSLNSANESFLSDSSWPDVLPCSSPKPSTSRTTGTPTKRKRISTRPAHLRNTCVDIEQAAKEAYSLMGTLAGKALESRDKYSVFGDLVAHKIRDLHPSLQGHVMHDIDNVLFAALQKHEEITSKGAKK